MKKKAFRLWTHEGEHGVAYLELLDFPHESSSGCVKRTVNVHNLIPDYDGPGIHIDFDEQGRAIGIEILYGSDPDDDAE